MLKLPTDGGAWMSKYPRDIPPPGTQQHTTGPTLSSRGTWTSAASIRTPAGATSETSTRRVRDSCSLNRSGGFEALRQDDGLRLEVLVEALGPELAPEARLLEAAERRREVHAHAVDAVGAGAHATGDVDTALRVAGPHRTRQAVVDVGEDRRLDVPTLVETGRAAATGDHPRALVAALGDVALHTVAVTRREHRADRGLGVERVAHLHRCRRGGDGIDDVVVARPRGEDAGLRDARLAVVHDRVRHESGDGRLEVGVVEDDRGRLATELERAALELLTADGTDLATRDTGAGEGDLVGVGVAHQVLAHLAVGLHDVEHAGREPGLLRDLGEEVRVERRLRRRLEHH